jgi:hypothetical protein
MRGPRAENERAEREGRTRGGANVHAKRGDRIVVESAQVGQTRREGEIIEVLGGDADEHFRVRWDDGHETIYFPQSDASVEHTGSRST